MPTDDLLTRVAAALPAHKTGDDMQTPMVPGLYQHAWLPAPELLVELLARPYMAQLFDIHADAYGFVYFREHGTDAEPERLTEAIFRDLLSYCLEALPRLERERDPFTDLRTIFSMASCQEWLGTYYARLWVEFTRAEIAATKARSASAPAQPEAVDLPVAPTPTAPVEPAPAGVETAADRRRRKDAESLARRRAAKAAETYQAEVTVIICWLHEWLDDPRAPQTVVATDAYALACECITPQPNQRLFTAVLTAVIGVRKRHHQGRATYELPPLAELIATVNTDDGVNDQIKVFASRALAMTMARDLQEVDA